MRRDFEVPQGEDPTASHRTYERLRAGCPVAHTDALGGFWMLTRHDDVARVAADAARYTTTVQNVVPKVAYTGRRPPLHLDPPEHTPYRAALNPLLSAERVARLEPLVFIRDSDDLRAKHAAAVAWCLEELAALDPATMAL